MKSRAKAFNSSSSSYKIKAPDPVPYDYSTRTCIIHVLELAITLSMLSVRLSNTHNVLHIVSCSTQWTIWMTNVFIHMPSLMKRSTKNLVAIVFNLTALVHKSQVVWSTNLGASLSSLFAVFSFIYCVCSAFLDKCLSSDGTCWQLSAVGRVDYKSQNTMLFEWPSALNHLIWIWILPPWMVNVQKN